MTGNIPVASIAVKGMPGPALPLIVNEPTNHLALLSRAVLLEA